MEQPTVDRHGNFHTQANLSRALNTIIQQHYIGVTAQADVQAPELPSFIQEGIHMICHSLAGAINGQPYNPYNWKDISKYADAVADVIITAQQNAAAERAEKAANEAPTTVAEPTPTEGTLNDTP